jgi:hypothetical protein
MSRVWVWLWAADAAMWLAGSFQIAILLTVGLSLFYGVSLIWLDFACPRCEGGNRRQAPGIFRRVFGNIARPGCRSRRCYGGRRLRMGVKVLQPRRANAWLATHR